MSLYYVEWLRSRLGSGKILLTYATALIRDDVGRLLFQRRTDFDWWGLPGGVLELGETFVECARREAREETCWEVEPTRLVGIYAGPQYDVRYPNGDEVQQCTVALECSIVRKHAKPDGHEEVAARFFARDELPVDCPLWYADMARDYFRGPREASFEPPVSTASSPVDFRELRAKTGAERIITIGAGAVVQNNRGGQVLLMQRSDSGLWGLPGGLMELGETPAGTIVREAYEELKITLEPMRLMGVFTGPDHFHTYPDGNQVQIVSILFACRWLSGVLQPDGVEALAADFFGPPALPSMFPIHANVVSQCLTYPNQALFT